MIIAVQLGERRSLRGLMDRGTTANELRDLLRHSPLIALSPDGQGMCARQLRGAACVGAGAGGVLVMAADLQLVRCA